jgi:hypothetical protein
MIPLESVIDGSIVVGQASVQRGDGYPGPSMSYFTGFPNPFRSDVTLRFRVQSLSDELAGATEHENIVIFDCAGREVRAIGVTLSPGEHSITWDGSDRKGVMVPPGVYFCRYPARDGFGTYKITRLD